MQHGLQSTLGLAAGVQVNTLNSFILKRFAVGGRLIVSPLTGSFKRILVQLLELSDGANMKEMKKEERLLSES